MDEINVSYNYLHGVVQNRGVCRVIAQLDELTARGSASCKLMMWSQKRNRWLNFTVGWTAVRIACTESQMFAMGPEGRVLRADAAGVNDEIVGDGSTEKGELKDMRLIGDHLYVVGAGGQVYRRESSAEWTEWNTGTDKATEFNAVHGLGESRIYAVGEQGAIWKAEEGAWQRLDSPTDERLNNVLEVEPGLVFATGDNGLLLCGKNDDWRIIAGGATKNNLFGLEWFANKLYVATEEGIYILQDDRLERANAGYGPGFTFKQLHARDGVMWSFGKEHLFQTEDGERWRNVTPHTTLFDPAESGPSAAQSSCGCGGGDHTGSGHRCD